MLNSALTGTPPLESVPLWGGHAGEAKPFLRWAGGKTWLLPLLEEHRPKEFGTFYEPFLGSGAVLLSIQASAKREASDLNPELINSFVMVRDQVSSLVAILKTYEYGEVQYLEARDRYNQLKRTKDASEVERAALFIYLNKSAFNGLYRENSKGEFNVPWGKRLMPPGNLEGLLQRASRNLRGDEVGEVGRAEFSVGGYESALRKASRGDWVYLDPPYVPLSKTSSFVGYTSDGFAASDQVALRDEAEAAVSRGAQILISNADTAEARSLYQGGPWRLVEVSVSRSVGAKKNTRKKVGELLVKSYE